MVKKALPKIIFLILLFILVCGNIFVSINSNNSDKKQVPFTASKTSNNTEVFKNSINGLEYDESFGGIYIDKQGIYNVNVVGDSSKIKKSIGLSNVKYHQVKWSKNKLVSVQDALKNKMDELNIKALSLNEMSNTIEVYMKSFDEQQKKKIMEIAGFTDLVFLKQDVGLVW